MTTAYKEIPPDVFNTDYLIGSMVRVSQPYEWGTQTFGFWSIPMDEYIEIRSGSILMYLGSGSVADHKWVGNNLDKETLYKFLFDNKIFCSVDPGRVIPERSFKWELLVEVDQHGMPIQISL